MQFRFTKIVFLGALVCSPCIAQAQTAVDVYKTEVAGLRAEMEVLKAALKGAVVAFDRKKAQPCPDGWKPFDQAGGRFVVGAGFNQNKSNSGIPLAQRPSILDDDAKGSGGEESVRLSIAQLPPHHHDVYPHAGFIVSGGGAPPPPNSAPGAGGGDTYTNVSPGVTSTTGGGIPVDVLPPFVALYYCLKD